MCFDIADGAGVSTPASACAVAITSICPSILGGVAGFAGAVVIDRRAKDDGVDGIAIGDRIVQPLQDNHGGTGTGAGPLRLGVERTAVPIWREDHPVFVEIPGALRGRRSNNTASDGEVAIPRD